MSAADGLLRHYERFSRGWLLHRTDLLIPPKSERATRNWNKRQLGSYTLKFHSRAQYHFGAQDQSKVHVLGIIMDVFDFAKDEAQICSALARHLANNGWHRFYEYLKHTAGTYILFVEHDGLSVILDATGTVPATHGQHQNSRIVASHARLVAQITNSRVSQVAREWSQHPKVGAGGRYMPGLLTDFEDIEIITPNQRFAVETGTMSRFYPDRNLPELDPKEIARQVAPLLSGQLKKLSASYKLAFSLSGGLDTRVTLATSRPVARSSKYFTYYTSNSAILSTDISIAQQLAGQLGLDHIALLLSYDRSTSHMRTAAYHDGILRATPIWSMHYNIFSYIGEDTIHVRSNILEVARGFYSKNIKNRENIFDAKRLSGLFTSSTKDEFIAYFDEFIQKASFYPDNILNIHYTDLFYWEHRLSSNYGINYREARPFFETYFIYNCRMILELMLSTDINNRINAVVMRHLIEDLWPETLQVPIFSGSKFIDLHEDRALRATKPKKMPAQPKGANPKGGNSRLFLTFLSLKRLAKAGLQRVGMR